MKVFLVCLCIGSAFATFSATASTSDAISLNGTTFTDTNTTLLVLGRGSSGYARADADSEGYIPGYIVEVSESDANAQSIGSIDQNGTVIILSETETEGNGENATSSARAKELVADVDGVGNVFSFGKSEAASFSNALDKVATTDAFVDVSAFGFRALVNTTADAEAEATVGRDENQVVVSESESEAEASARVFDGIAITRSFTELQTEGLDTLADANAFAIANAAPLSIKLPDLFD